MPYPVNPLDSNDSFAEASHRELLAYIINWINNHPLGGSVTIRKNSGVDVGTRARLNLIEGANVTISAVDDAGSGEVDITITSTGGSGSVGQQGPPGLDGDEGPEGPQGLPGPSGAKGDTGSAGVPGAAGPQGLMGPWGFDGEDGADGFPGPPGSVGPQGPQGNPGSPGAAGAVGPMGPWGLDGIEGDEGTMGLPGPAGSAGVAGAPGATGPTGIGIPGQDGQDGDFFFLPGPPGPKGDTGAPGGGGGSATTVEVNLGSTAKTTGKFTITDAAIGAASKVLVWQAPGPYTGKGTRADEAELAPVRVLSCEQAAGSAVVKWSSAQGFAAVAQSLAIEGTFLPVAASRLQYHNELRIEMQVRGKVRGNVKFSYMILA